MVAKPETLQGGCVLYRLGSPAVTRAKFLQPPKDEDEGREPWPDLRDKLTILDCRLDLLNEADRQFANSLLDYFVKHERLTDRQSYYVDELVARTGWRR
jgi:hypothetical protein